MTQVPGAVSLLNPEDILSGQLEYGKPVVDLAAGDAHALVAAPRNALRAVAALVSAQSEGVDQPAFEAGMGLAITPQLALDGSSFVFAGAVPLKYPRPPAPVLDALGKGLSGCDGPEDQGNSSRNCPLEVFDHHGPLDLSERGVVGDELVVGNHPGDKQGHGLAVLTARDFEPNESPHRIISRHSRWIGISGDGGRRRGRRPLMLLERRGR